MKFNKPKINNCVSKTFSSCFMSNDFSNGIFSDDLTFDLSLVTFDSCIFESINFGLARLDRVDLIDVIFKDSDLSNQCFDGRLLSRVSFVNCKLIGTSFIGSGIKNVSFTNCNCRYTNFTGSSINNFIINNSDFSDSIFNECELKNVCFDGVKLCDSEFLRGNFSNVDFSSCDICGINFDKDSIDGIIIDRFQAFYIVSLFGVKIKD